MKKVEHRPTSVVTRHGLEIVVPTPHQVDGSLVGFYVLLMVVAPLLFMFAEHRAEGVEGSLDTFGRLFGWWWLALGFILSVMLIAFSRFSNDQYVFGTRLLRRQRQIGRIALSSNDWRLSRIARVEARANAHGVWTVHLRGSGRLSPWVMMSGLGQEDAEILEERIRRWIEAPGEAPVESADRDSTPVMVVERAVSLVTSRVSLVVPLLIASTSLLVLALGWQLREAQHGRAEPLPRMERVADGELLAYRWVIYAPTGNEDAYNARAFLRVAIGYVPDDGQRRVLWLRTREAPEVYRVRDQLGQAAAMLGLPHVEFQVPEWADSVTNPSHDWVEWRLTTDDRSFSRSYYAAHLLGALDEPFHYLSALWTAPSPDWRVAYSAASPERAMPLRWAEAERTAMRQLSLRAMAPVGGIALLLVFWTVPGLVSSGSRRWLGRLAALGAVLAIPWWAEYAERATIQLGTGDWAVDLASDVLRLGLPQDLTQHAFLVRSRPPAASRTGVSVLWTPERSETADLLRTLGLDTPPSDLPLPDSGSAVEHMRARVSTALAGLSMEELSVFLEEYDRAGYRHRLDTMHEAVIEPVLCTMLTDSSLSGGVRRNLQVARTGYVDGGGELCQQAAALDRPL